MSGEGFLSRWSRRKRAAEHGAPEEPAAAPPDPLAPAPAAPAPTALAPTALAPGPVAPELDLSDLPRIEDLTVESPITPFLRPGVPAALRGAALRRMWSLDPVIRDFVGPAEYAWDFNAPGGVPGFSFELAGDLRMLLAQATGQAEPEEAPAADATVPAEEAPPVPEAPDPVIAQAPIPEAPAAPEPEEPGPAPRRRHGSALPS